MADMRIHVRCPDCGGIGEYQNGDFCFTCRTCGGSGGILVDEKDADNY